MHKATCIKHTAVNSSCLSIHENPFCFLIVVDWVLITIFCSEICLWLMSSHYKCQCSDSRIQQMVVVVAASPPAWVGHQCHLDQDIILVQPYEIILIQLIKAIFVVYHRPTKRLNSIRISSIQYTRITVHQHCGFCVIKTNQKVSKLSSILYSHRHVIEHLRL